MGTMNTAPPPPRTGGEPVRPKGSLGISAPPPPSRRRWVWVTICAAVAVLAMLGAIAAVNGVSDRQQVLAVGRNVPAGQQLTAKDLVVAEVAADPALRPVSADERKEMVGRYATVGLRKGSLLTGSQVSATNRLAEGKQMVGIEAKRGQLPSKALAAGDAVSIVATPSEGEEAGIGTGKSGAGSPDAAISGTVAAVSPPDASDTVVVNVAVSPSDGPDLAARAASGNVAIVLEPRG
jgi:SAF domain-containing protein